MNTYKTSLGERITQKQIDINIRLAKAIVIEKQLEEHGYNFCTECNRNDCKPIDCAHEISVKEAKETGRTELCWDINNIKLIGRKHHQIKDGLNLQFNNKTPF